MPEDHQQSEETELEVVAPSALESMERAAVDVQISTAKKYPRVLSKVKANMLSFATLDMETAAGCFFTLPGRKGGDGKPIQGPSIRMAEIAISTYQNLRAGARVIGDDGKMITAQGVCHDLENNVCITVEVKRRVTTKDGRRYSDDMIVMTGNAACSIALRNATFRVVPLALVKPIYEAAKKTAIGDAKTLVSRRADAMSHFTKMGVPKERIFAALEVNGIEDIGLEQLATLIGFANAIRDKETSIDECFPDPAATGEPGAKKVEGISGEKKTGAAPTGLEANQPDDPAAKKKAIDELEGLLLDAGWTEKGAIGLIHNPAQGPLPAKIADLPLASLTKLVEMAKKETGAKK